MRAIAIALTLLCSTPAAAQSAAIPAATAEEAPGLQQRIETLIPAMRGELPYDRYFAPVFRDAVPEAKFLTIARELEARGGAIERVARVEAIDGHTATVSLRMARGTALMDIAVEPEAPHRVTGLIVTGLLADAATLAEVAKGIAALPGTTGLALARLGDGGPHIVTGVAPDRPLAIASAFKLVILARLVREIESGDRHWEDKVTLGAMPLPAGKFAGKAAGTETTLHALAEAMIATSDNSATDILLAELGRKKVEAMLPVVGVADPGANRPLLSTLELFKLKGGNPALAKRWRTASRQQRRRLLDEIDRLPVSAIDPKLFADGTPVMPDIEWFASPADLVRTLDWLLRHTEHGSAARARDILAANPGVGPAVAARMGYVGFKGGSEPGVLNLSFLIQARNGDWYAMSTGWNDTTSDVSLDTLLPLASRAVALIADAAPGATVSR